MISISQSDLETLLRETEKAQFVSLTCVTVPRMRKRDNPHPNARKVSILTGCICWTYRSSVNKQRVREQREADFLAMRRRWGKRIKNTPLVQHKKKRKKSDTETPPTLLFLEVKIESRGEHYFNPTTGKTIKLAKLQPFLKPPGKTRQELDRIIVLRDYALTNIAEITLRGIRYTIAPAAAELHRYIPAPKPRRAKAPVKADAKATRRRSTPTAKRKRPGAKP